MEYPVAAWWSNEAILTDSPGAAERLTSTPTVAGARNGQLVVSEDSSTQIYGDLNGTGQ